MEDPGEEVPILQNFLKKMSDWSASSYNIKRTIQIDRRFRLVYTASFVVFNIGYWTFYLTIAQHK